uniref:Uncharacterized protein n=1 Tax=Romanomermis culicivorax TaxID=13658 RepID=A0A915I0F6_ROMCU
METVALLCKLVTQANERINFRTVFGRQVVCWFCILLRRDNYAHPLLHQLPLFDIRSDLFKNPAT